ncbi:glycosyltransferase [Micromonospora schwarzwaldensis]|uniref:glycosyltransferase n=1 Tax=Micromonospora sp. DSM 45708 TaxID=3111767 RepID=UPI0031D4E88F
MRTVDDGARADAADTCLHRVLLPKPGAVGGRTALLLDVTGTVAGGAPDGLALRGGERVSLGSYLNAFPAGYWARWSALEQVVLRLRVAGDVRVDVYRSAADGSATRVAGLRHRGPDPGCLETRLPLTGFDEGGWYWFDVTAPTGDARLLSGAWHAPGRAPGRAAVVVGMPTFNRPDDCVAVLRAMAGHPELRRVVTRIVVVDQGTDRITAHPDFRSLRDDLGDNLRVIEQDNLGGSGGYTRALREALGEPGCEQIAFMDDDIVVEPESILRAVAFARHARHPLVVGGQMLNREIRSQLYVLGEQIDKRSFRWRQPPGAEYDHDFSVRSLPDTPWLHRRVDVSYNSWWMCVFPRDVAARLGRPLPLFLKWDDVEYGLRAAREGVPTVSVPGVAVWHEPWWSKDEENGWQTYFHSRNRLVTASLHGSARWLPRLVAAHLTETLQRLVSMQYWHVGLRNAGVGDFLKGPEVLAASLPTARARAVEIHGRYAPQAVDPQAETPPLADPRSPAPTVSPPGSGPGSALRLLRALARGCLPIRRGGSVDRRPHLSAEQAQWYVLAHVDAAAVASPDGTQVTLRERRPALFRRLLVDTLATHARLALALPRVRRAYRRRAERLESWSEPATIRAPARSAPTRGHAGG